MYGWMHMHKHATCMRARVCVCLCFRARMCACMHASIAEWYDHFYVRVWMHWKKSTIEIRVCLRACMCVRVHVRLRGCVHAHWCVCVCVYVVVWTNASF
jgi:hypothetical protein